MHVNTDMSKYKGVMSFIFDIQSGYYSFNCYFFNTLFFIVCFFNFVPNHLVSFDFYIKFGFHSFD